MTDSVTADPAQTLAFGVVPPSIDVSTPASKQMFTPQFSVANLSTTAAVNLQRAQLLVPVTTAGTNLASKSDMSPSALTPGWTFECCTSPQTGYVALTLVPNDGVGAIAPGGSVAFALSNVEVSTGPPGSAVLPFEAKTSLGTWTTQAGIALTPPGSTAPTITRYSVTPADPHTLRAVQGQSVVINWTSTGTAYCNLEDDQGHTWPNLPTVGIIRDTPAVGNATVKTGPDTGRYYNRTYTLTAYSAGSQAPDQKSNTTIILLPTILSFSVTPNALKKVGDTVAVSWSVSGLDPDTGHITLSLAPTDGTGPYTIDIPPGRMSGTGVVTPTPLTTTTYSLAAGGPGGAAPELPPQSVASQLPAGFVPIGRPPPVSKDVMTMSLAAFAGRLWCAYPTPGLYTTADGTNWTTVTPQPALPPIDGLLVTRDGAVETLWAFGTDGNTPFVASSADGKNWTRQQTPPYPHRVGAGYAVNAGRLYVAGGLQFTGVFPRNPLAAFAGDLWAIRSPEDAAAVAIKSLDGATWLNDVWSSPDGRAWVKEGEQFTDVWPNNPLAAFAGELWAIRSPEDAAAVAIKSSDGATWVPQPPNVPTQPFWGFLLQAVGDQLWLGAAPNGLLMGKDFDRAGSWTTLGLRVPCSIPDAVLSAQVFADCLWLGFIDDAFQPQFFVLNRVLPGTTFTLAPSTESAST